MNGRRMDGAESRVERPKSAGMAMESGRRDDEECREILVSPSVDCP